MESRLYTENLQTAVNYLKELRLKTDHPIIREFFNRIKMVSPKNKDTLSEIFQIYHSVFGEEDFCSQEYKQFVLKLGGIVFDAFFKKQISGIKNANLDNVSMEEKIKSFTEISFYLTSCHMLYGLLLNDKSDFAGFSLTLIDKLDTPAIFNYFGAFFLWIISIIFFFVGAASGRAKGFAIAISCFVTSVFLFLTRISRDLFGMSVVQDKGDLIEI